MFKKFVIMISESDSYEETVNNIFYGENGIDMAFQKGKLTAKEHETLYNLIRKIWSHEVK